MAAASVALCDCTGGGRGQRATDAAADSSLDVAPPPTGTCGGADATALASCVSMENYIADLTVIAAPRPPGSAHWQVVQDLCADRFASLGFTVERHDYGTGTNVIGVLAGTDLPEEQVVVSAHYDSVQNCAGADDNGTGVAGVLEAARVLASTSHKRTLIVACWDEEEAGLIGSRAYADRAAADGQQIVMAYVFEMIGFATDQPNTQAFPAGFDLLFADLAAQVEANENRGDFVALVIGDDAKEPAEHFLTHAAAAELPTVHVELSAIQRTDPLFGQLNARSDHSGFWSHGYPATMITDTSEFRNPHYHCVDGAAILDVVEDAWPVKDDAIDTLDHAFATSIVQAAVGSAAATLDAPIAP